MAGPRPLRFIKPQLRFLASSGAGAVTGALTGMIFSGGVLKRGASPTFRVVVRGA